MFTFNGIKQNMSFAQVMLYSHHLHFIRFYVVFWCFAQFLDFDIGTHLLKSIFNFFFYYNNI